MALYAIEFGALGDTRPVPDLTVQTTDLDTLNRTVVEHARPHITPVLTKLGRPELADCLFRMNKDRTMGQFLHLNLVTGMGAEFLPARITTTPERIQRKRTKGWEAPGGAKYVGRGTRWGNPFTVTDCIESAFATTKDEARRVCTEQFGQWLAGELAGGPGPDGTPCSRGARNRIRADIEELRGRELMCWCPLPEPGQPDHCHGAVLLALANAPKEN